MFNLFKKQKRYKDLTLDIASVAAFLVNDSGSDLPNPLKEFLNSSKLDYSLESLKYVDSYLNEVRKNRKNLTNDQLVKVVVRCGAYCGEVVRKLSKKSLYWIDYDTAIVADPRVKSFDKSLYTFYILFAEPMDFSFPLAKAGKYLDNGPEDSLYAFALVVGDLKK
ncbi:MAG: hypothetical protein V4699_03270 [Patescibacteria group bacterium]